MLTLVALTLLTLGCYAIVEGNVKKRAVPLKGTNFMVGKVVSYGYFGHVSEKSEQNAKDQQEKSGDTFGFDRFTPDDMTCYGKVPVIISGKQDLDNVRENIEKNFKPEEASVKEELPLIQAMKVEVDPFNFKKLKESLPQGVVVTPDRKVIRPPHGLGRKI